MLIYKDKKIAILGLSVEGVDCASFFSQQQAHITCCDRRSAAELGNSYSHFKKCSVSFHLGKDYLDHLEQYDIIVRTPGMSPRIPELVKARQSGVVITSATQLFFDVCPASIIGVTGTKGKGTTSSLISEIFKEEKRNVWLGGNIGIPLLSSVSKIRPSDVVVYELSSFQLEDLHTSPHIAVVLTITCDHLANEDPNATNYHKDITQYREAKMPIVKYQKAEDIVIVNADNATSKSFAALTPASRFSFSSHTQMADAYVFGNTVYVRKNGSVSKICSMDEIRLLGVHNLENIAAASLTAIVAGASVRSVRRAVTSFCCLPHRLEHVRSLNDVSYYNDSFSTTPETAIAAIRSFNTPIILIAGGSDKKSDYTHLGNVLADSTVRVLVAIGITADKIVRAAHRAGYKGLVKRNLKTMHEIVSYCAKIARPGDTVLLSPSCASFDMFKNYKERGNQFNHEVTLLS